MTTRRAFLQTVSASLLASAAVPLVGRQTLAQGTLKHPFTGQLGIQLYSLRHRFQKGDVAGALELIRSWGLTNVEGGAPKGMSAADFAATLKKYGLKAPGTGVDYAKLTTGLDAVIADAKALGSTFVMCAWIPHQGRFGLADVEKAVPVFNEAGKKMRAAGLRFCYHVHGYEFQPGPDGMLFDTMAKRTDPAAVEFEMDLFWVVRGGGNPVDLFTKYPKRFPLTHVKDMQKGLATGDPTGAAPDETSVPLGQGQLDWPAIVRAANAAGAEYHFIEDEHPDAEKQIPQTLKFLASLKA